MPSCVKRPRMRLRSPALPDDLAVIWDYFVEQMPYWLWKKHTLKDIGGAVVENTLGIVFLRELAEVRSDLGAAFSPNPANPPKKKARLEGKRDEAAFANWIRRYLKENSGKLVL